MAIYMGSNIQMETKDWNSLDPRFYIKYVDPNTDEGKAIYHKFPHKNVYYLGSHIGCGCGFQNDEDTINYYEKDEIEKNATTILELKKYLSKAIDIDDTIKILSCWEGEQSQPIEKQLTINIKDIDPYRFNFEEKAYYKIRND